ncbi:phospholipase D family protein [Paenalcaligenes niemegkensis]|uniref:phospholipase D family protein n=1 Tax=Paenalcaligenes niemegkensis TaxID=2895469 RepID=UPI001EE98DC6|nr:phospholipase D family protein [Paenalcaligenes niemegkensis]MCQ9616087.1 phospholipase D family protein [Paenalcaligenes niemegkensis]
MLRILSHRLWRYLVVLSLASLLGCSLPPAGHRIESTAISTSEALDTQLGKALSPLAKAHPGLSGIRSLPDAHEAFAVRVLLAKAAQKTLDIQYYIWRNDTTGGLMLQTLKDAADRGVRIRLLLDDNGITDLDTALVTLDNHPNIQVRLFNPFMLRSPKFLGYLFEFKRLNRRMHNKSFTADNSATIVGGRNIGDEYFGAVSEIHFTDLDVLAIGKVVNDVSEDFDRYWSSESSYPVSSIVQDMKAYDLSKVDLTRLNLKLPDRRKDYIEAISRTAIIRDLLGGELGVEWVPTEIISDDPAKALDKAHERDMFTYQLSRAIGTPRSQVDLISSYFVPTKAGVDSFIELMKTDGLNIRILTNSYDATDVAVVHAGYAKWRKILLANGIELYELKKLSSGDLKKSGIGRFGSSGSSLHAKTFSIDHDRLFVGSFNFDPRSAHLNTELGFVIHSPKLANEISSLFDKQIPRSSYQVKLSPEGKLIWVELDDGASIIHTQEPGTSMMSRFGIGILSKLPIDWLL